MTTQTTPDLRVCANCGRRSTDIINEQTYIGGHGYVWITICEDHDACRRRREGEPLER